jgi:hypothetical protein
MSGLWCGKVPDGVSQEEPLSKLQIKGAHDRDQQVVVTLDTLFCMMLPRLFTV